MGVVDKVRCRRGGHGCGERKAYNSSMQETDILVEQTGRELRSRQAALLTSFFHYSLLSSLSAFSLPHRNKLTRSFPCHLSHFLPPSRSSRLLLPPSSFTDDISHPFSSCRVSLISCLSSGTCSFVFPFTPFLFSFLSFLFVKYISHVRLSVTVDFNSLCTENTCFYRNLFKISLFFSIGVLVYSSTHP